MALLEIMVWTLLAVCMTPLARWRMRAGGWDYVTWARFTNAEVQNDPSTPRKWIIAFMLSELTVIGLGFGTEKGEHIRKDACEAVSAVPLHHLMCPPQPSWL
jgi:hypothetical protein